jgi:hypothetical protein
VVCVFVVHRLLFVFVNILSSSIRRQQQHQFSILRHPQLLNVATKRTVLQIDASLQQNQQVQQSVLRSLVSGQIPDSSTARCLVKVRRDHLLEDALSQVPLNVYVVFFIYIINVLILKIFKKKVRIAETIGKLKLPLMVEFEDEPAVDAGGVRKEFFQVILL